MDRAKTGAGEHRLERFGHHRHVNNDTIAFFDAFGAQRARQTGNPVLEFAIGDLVHRVCDRTVVNNRYAVPVTGLDMSINGIPAAVYLTVGEPFVERSVFIKKCF